MKDLDPAFVDELIAAGFSREEIDEAARTERLALLPIDRVLQGGEPRYTRAELAEKAGLPVDLLIRLWRELGMAEVEDGEVAFTDSDLEAVRSVAQFHAAGLDADTLASVTNVIGHGMSRLADTLREVVGEALLQSGDDERTVGLRYAQAGRCSCRCSSRSWATCCACTCASRSAPTSCAGPRSTPAASRTRGGCTCASPTSSASRAWASGPTSAPSATPGGG